MNYVEKFFDGVQSVLNLNAATFSGACDIIVIKRVGLKNNIFRKLKKLKKNLFDKL